MSQELTAVAGVQTGEQAITSVGILERADARLRDESYWIKHGRHEALDLWGNPCEPQGAHACRWSLIGAIEFSNSDLPSGPREKAAGWVLRALFESEHHPGCLDLDWEGFTDVTFAMVKQVLLRALELAKGGQP